MSTEIKTRKRIIITSGEPAGIGPDLVFELIKLQQDNKKNEYLVLADPDLLSQRAHQLGIQLDINLIDEAELNKADTEFKAQSLNVLAIQCPNTVVAGKLDTGNASYVMQMLDKAVELCQQNLCHAMVTCPIQKSTLIEAGFKIQGHTEFLAQLCGVSRVVMMLSNPHLRVALATTHIPLAQVSASLNEQLIIETLEIIDQDLQLKFGINNPQIYVCGLNPHAGENGHMGNEEQDFITPALEHLRNQGLKLHGPLPADTIFNEATRQKADAYLAMYHDQGLPVLKALGFGNSINITLGLPIIRTSVDHGTALDLAGTGKASPQSFMHAIECATEMACHQHDT